MTLDDAAAYAAIVLGDAGVEQPERLVKWLIADTSFANAPGDQALPGPEVAAFGVLVDRLADGEPLGYVTGVAHFFGLKLEVRQGCLIPRPETEELVRWILESHKESSGQRIADVCCGSGCIGLALLAKGGVGWRGTAIDISPTCLEITRANAAKLGVGERFHVDQSDVLASESYLDGGERYGIVVANPPYIPDDDWLRVDPVVSSYEPHLALRVPETTPLVFYQAIASTARHGLRPGGWLYFECNDRYTDEVARLLDYMGYAHVEVLVDMQGAPRHVRGQWGG